MSDNVITGRVNWELLKALNQAPADQRFFSGTWRCVLCGREDQFMMQGPDWAHDPPDAPCSEDQEECGGYMLRVDNGEQFTVQAPSEDP